MFANRRLPFFWMLAAWVALTFTLTSIPNPQFGIDVSHADKYAHFFFYGVIGFLFTMWRRESGDTVSRAVLGSLLFVAAFGAFDEAHQYFIPGRSMELLDWAADLGGGTGGAMSAGVVPILLPRLRAR